MNLRVERKVRNDDFAFVLFCEPVSKAAETKIADLINRNKNYYLHELRNLLKFF